MQELNVKKDITVIGGGLAGVCAAIAAAGNGTEVALVHERPVLGGNSSSEIRMVPLGATGGGNKFAEEMGIIGELKLENLYKNPEGNPYLWDAILLDHVLKVENIKLYLNTTVFKAETDNGKILSVSGIQQGSETIFSFDSEIFIDCTGDGTVGFLAGAEFVSGREGRSEFNESFAPEVRDLYTLGNTIYFDTKDVGYPVKFFPPSFAYPIDKIKGILAMGNRHIDAGMGGFDYWWIEYGGLLDTIHDNEEIKYELQRIAYGIWNYIKNSGKFEAENLTLDWIGSIPGKRESRRFIGDYIMTQNDLTAQTEFEDAVCYGGWSIDTHPEEGIYSTSPASSHQWVNPYNIPFRCLYSCNIENLMFAGRNISATHIAFASTRIMNTCALMGQAVGIGAAMAVKKKTIPRDVGQSYKDELQENLLKDDCYFIGGRNRDENDRARSAKVASSGYRAFESTICDNIFPVDEDVLFTLPAIPWVDTISLLLYAERDTELNVEVYLSDKPQNYRVSRKITSSAFKLKSRTQQWVNLDIALDGNRSNIIIRMLKNEGVSVCCSSMKCTGTGAWYRQESNQPFDFHPCFKIRGFQDAYNHQNVINGYQRIFGMTNLWCSENIQSGPQWIELDFGKTIEINEVLLFFNPNLNREYYNLRPDYWKNGWDRMPGELVKSYKLFALCEGEEVEIANVKENFNRRAKHLFHGIKTDRLRVSVEQTWGSSFAEIFEIRVY